MENLSEWISQIILSKISSNSPAENLYWRKALQSIAYDKSFNEKNHTLFTIKEFILERSHTNVKNVVKHSMQTHTLFTIREFILERSIIVYWITKFYAC